VFRAIQLASQLGFKLDEDIFDCDIDFSLGDFNKDFVFSYWKDLLLNSPAPSIGLEYMKRMRILEIAHIEINNLVGVGQNPDWHQEGDAWTHTKMVVDAGARICRVKNLDEEGSLVLMLACLCHDLGKPTATKMVEGKLRAKGHDKEGELPTKYFLENIGTPKSIIKKVIPLVTEHMFTHDNDFTPERVASLAKRICPATIKELVYLAEADCQGMINCQKDNNARNDLLSLAESLGLD
jgi:tRNA nucleotidyltransferase (CCA-adding enzyme)